jgi:DNA-binding SARP family transcriptional activator
MMWPRSGDLRVQLLGPLRVWRHDIEVEVGPTARRAVLALLALADGQPVGQPELIDALWEDRPPRSASNVIHTYVRHLRRRLEPDRPARRPSTVLASVGNGYALRLSPGTLDIDRFVDLTAAAADARSNGDHHQAAALLSRALELWQGPVLADIPSLVSHARVVALTNTWQSTVASYADSMIRIGAADEVLEILGAAARAQPLDETVHALLIRAQHAAGRHDEASEAFRVIRRRLADELAVAPGPELVAAHTGAPDDDAGHRSRGEVRPPVPTQLPAAGRVFVGREESLRQLDAIHQDAARLPLGAVTIIAVQGAAGIGKTTLALRWAHRVAAQFPDGQFCVNLRGFDPSDAALTPSDVLHGFLEALGVPAGQIPTVPEAKAGLFRSMLTGRRMLILLDNARDSEQVRPLLPGSPGSLVLVTSRNRLTGLVTAEGAHPVGLDLLTVTEARELLAARLGASRVAAERHAADEIIAGCARLPLALAVAAGRAVSRPDLSLAAMADDLSDAAVRLDVLSSGERDTDLRTVFSCSYRALDPPDATMFRLLGLHPTPEFTVVAAASLAGMPVDRARSVLNRLTGTHLLRELRRHRLVLHDLLRAYAAELTAEEEPCLRRAALQRMLDHYLHTARAAARALQPVQDADELPPPLPGVTVATFVDAQAASVWFGTERDALLAAVELAHESGFDRHACDLAAALRHFLDRRCFWEDILRVQASAIASAERLGDPSAKGRAHRDAGAAYLRLARHDEADAHYEEAERLFGVAGDPIGVGQLQVNRAVVLLRRDRPADALRVARQGLRVLRSADKHAQAMALNIVAVANARVGRYDEAIAASEEALRLHRDSGNAFGEANSWAGLGLSHHGLGRYAEAAADFQRAIEIFRAIGDRFCEADIWIRVGDLDFSAERHNAAGAAWRRGLTILTELRRDTDGVRKRLRQLDGGE